MDPILRARAKPTRPLAGSLAPFLVLGWYENLRDRLKKKVESVPTAAIENTLRLQDIGGDQLSDGDQNFGYMIYDPLHLPAGWVWHKSATAWTIRQAYRQYPEQNAGSPVIGLPVTEFDSPWSQGDLTPAATTELRPVTGRLGRWHTYHSTDLTTATNDDFEDRNSVAMAAAPANTFWQMGHYAYSLGIINTNATDAALVQAAINGKTSNEVLGTPMFATAQAAPAAVGQAAGHVTVSGYSGRAAKTATEIIQLTVTTIAGTIGALRCFAQIQARQVA